MCSNISEDSISVIIPFYSGSQWLDEALESVISQTLQPYEIIVINDGSKENIDDLILKYKGKVNFVYQENGGAASARNHGMRLSKGAYIAFLDSDDIWLPEKLNVQLTYMKKNNLLWSHCPYSVFDDKTRDIIRHEDNCVTEGMIFPRSLARCRIGTPCVMIKRECLDNIIMYFNENMRQGQDYCFWNVLAKKYRLGNVKESLVLVRDHNTNIAKNVFYQIKFRKNMYDYLHENKEYFGKIPFLLKLAFWESKISYSLVYKIRNAKVQKFFSYIFYFLPWLNFRLYYRFTHNG